MVKKAHLNFANYLNSLEQSLTRIEKATDKYNEDHKIASWLTKKSDLVSNHSGKIAITYASLIVGVIALCSYVIDEKDPWYELCALPTTSLAMLQILLSFPGMVLSNRQTKEMNNNMFQVLENNTRNRVLPKDAYRKEFEGETRNRSTAAYINVREDARIDVQITSRSRVWEELEC